MKKYVFSLLVSFLFIVNIFGQAAAVQDSLALVDFYNSTGGPNWTDHTNWLTTAPLGTWRNVTVSNGRVTYLYLDGNNISGKIPVSFGNLTKLGFLSIDGAHLTDSLPSSFGNLTSLTYLDLSSNQLSGPIPSSLGNLSNVSTLLLNNNNLSGTIPSALANISALNTLSLDNNQLTGTIPAAFGNLANLYSFTVGHNQLSGAVPSNISKPHIPYLNTLVLNNNLFTYAGIEAIAQVDNSAQYAPQKTILEVVNNNNVLSVIAGGTLANNTYSWYNGSSLVSTKTGDSTFAPGVSGHYYVSVTNSIANQLVLSSDTLNVIVSSNPNVPTITSFSPTTAGPDDTITINGSNFISTSQVRIAGYIVAANIVSTTMIKAVVGVYTGSGSISVNNGTDTAKLSGYTWNGYPVITSINPGSAAVGETVTITGKYIAPGGFFPIAPTISFGGTSASSVTATSYSVVQAVIASGSTSGNLVLTTGFGTTSHAFTINGLPSSTIDSLALVDLYNSTNGVGWTHAHANWLTTAPVSTWTGITVRNGRVTKIDLSYSNLLGQLPASLGNVTQLDTLILLANQISGTVPSTLGNLTLLKDFELEANLLSGPIPSTFTNFSAVQVLELNNNLFTFSGMENIVQNYHGIPFLNYVAQSAIPVHQQGNTVAVSAGGTLSNNTYKWYNNNTLVSTKTGDSTFTVTVSGKYSVAVTNVIANQLTLYSDTLNVTVQDPLILQDSLALVDLYNSTNGPGWSGHVNWLTAAPLSTWDGVTVQNGRVTQLYLIDYDLAGTLPSSLGDLSKLTLLGLGDNRLTGSIPSSISNLSNLVDLYLYNNQLTGNIPSSFSAPNMSNLHDFDLDNNQLSGDVSMLSNLADLSTLYVNNNNFTFTGMEALVQAKSPAYTPQKTILSVDDHNNLLSVSAGGTLSNNTYKWYNGSTLVSTKTGDSTLLVTVNGRYSVAVTNAVATQLTLQSDTLGVTISTNQNDTTTNNAFSSIGAYPNPAHGVATIVFGTQTAGNYNITIINSSGIGMILINGNTVAGQNVIPVNIQGLAPGIYMVTLTDNNGRHSFELSVQ
jgi:Leucine-rich repeat (LRR) protein